MTTPYDPLSSALGPASNALGPWQKRLLIYLRLLAGFMLMKTVYSWMLIGGLWDVDGSHFQLLSFAAQAAVVWAAIMNPAAAIGLWLGAAWGVVLWLVTTLVQILISATAPEGVGSLYIVAAVEAVLVIAYGVVAFRAGREEQD
ncbi:MAG TPA: DUF6163 family protein [Xanthobacteraceae bacterium]|nr:DUF6163 family protein [Xanthobacteraceae bacterium]